MSDNAIGKLPRRKALGWVLAGLGSAFAITRRSFGATARQTKPMLLPFELIADTIILALRVGTVPVNVVLDSGALGSAMDIRLAKRLNLLTAGKQRVSGVDGAVTLPRTSAFDVAFGERTVHFQKSVAIDLAEISSTIGRDIHLIVGKEIFFRFAVEFDFQRLQLGLHEPGSKPGAGGSHLEVTFGELGEPMITISIEGAPPIQAMCDLGNGTPLMVSRAYAEQKNLLSGRRTSSAAIAGIQGVTISTSIILRSLNLAELDINEIPTEIMNDWQSRDSVANVGLPILSRFRLLVDFAAARIWLKSVPVLRSRPFDINRSGLGVSIMPDRLIVRHIARGSPAEQGQWKIGDIITAVNGRAIDSGYSLSPRARWSYEAVGTPVKLRLSTGENRTIVLAEYY